MEYIYKNVKVPLKTPHIPRNIANIFVLQLEIVE